ncbi:MAG: hypothetical protein KA712_06015 [Myxococcales bacterium]|nr:hypothetical protein [Myxococcales bacterium]
MMKSGSRIPAPKVEPIVLEGIRYEQVRNGLLAGLDQMGGYLAAYDDASGHRLWFLKVYGNRRTGEKEGDAQDVFFRSMVAESDGTLRIENERRELFLVDVNSRTVSRPD